MFWNLNKKHIYKTYKCTHNLCENRKSWKIHMNHVRVLLLLDSKKKSLIQMNQKINELTRQDKEIFSTNPKYCLTVGINVHMEIQFFLRIFLFRNRFYVI